MHIITGRNVNEVYPKALALVRRSGVPQASRAGPVLTVPEPVVLETLRPMERVLLDPKRDANPFFHLAECLWLMAGRQDAAFLDRFVSDFGKRFAEWDGRLHGAYGHRWRKHFGFDQLDTVVEKLKANPLDRRVVIQMWDPTLKWGHKDEEGASDLVMAAKDIPCNTQILPRIVPFGGDPSLPGYQNWALDLMVTCRSNDVVWGACGANAVHFAFLQEYLAGRIGVQVGTLRQMTTNLHGYVDVLEKVGEPFVPCPDPYFSSAHTDPVVSAVPIGNDWEHWDKDLRAFLQWVEDGDGFVSRNTWFQEVARPMWLSHKFWREKDLDKAVHWAEMAAASDWRLAAKQWLQRRIDKRAAVGEVRAS
jgi:thymidylate synthase